MEALRIKEHSLANWTIAGGLALLVAACGSTHLMSPGPGTPAATGDVKFSVKKNDNNKLTISADHLPPPENIDAELQGFVVWLRTPDGKNTNLGQLKVAKDRSAKMETSTPHETFGITITIEKTPTAAEPGPYVVLSTEVD